MSRLKFDTLRSIASSGITSSYQVVGSSFTKAPSLIKVINDSTQDVTISADGVKDNDYVPSQSFSLYDCTSNSALSSSAFLEALGVFVKGTAGTGNIYVTVLYLDPA